MIKGAFERVLPKIIFAKVLIGFGFLVTRYL